MIYVSVEEKDIDFAYYAIFLNEQHVDIKCESFDHFKQEVKRFSKSATLIQHGEMMCQK